MTLTQSLQSVREAVIDGRMQNVIYRQIQLERLHKTLVDQGESIEQAIIRDSGHTDAEAVIEYLLTLHSLRTYYQSLDPAAALKDEYAISRGEDATGRRDAVGIVYLVPTTYTMFYSVIVGVSAALAAGNCVVIELENSLLEIPALLRRLLKSSLDPSIIEIVSSRASADDLGPHHIRVFQNNPSSPVPTSTSTSTSSSSAILSAPAAAWTVAVVDRTADLVKAAEALVAARFSFGGNSPYAPDVVLVNEFVKKAFLVALTKATMHFTVNVPSVSVGGVDAKRTVDGDSLLLSTKNDDGDGINIVTSLGRGKILDVTKRDSKLLGRKISGSILLVHSIRSLDDAIDLANRNGTLLASYIFANAESAKYLGQFITSRVSFINQIPVEMLVGPCAPENSVVHRTIRYSTDLFSVPRPLYNITSTNTSTTTTTTTAPGSSSSSPFSPLLHASLRNGNSEPISKTLLEVSRELGPRTKRPLGGQVGFFEQGILTGFGLFVVSALLGVGTLSYYGVRLALKYRARV